MPYKKKPLCPGDPNEYILIETKEKCYWRKKRGRVKEARLNAGFKASQELTQMVSPAAARVMNALRPYTKELQTGRLNVRIGSAFRKSYKETGGFQLSYLKGLELQGDYPLADSLLVPVKVTIEKTIARIEIPIEKGNVKAWNPLVTNYWFEAVLLFGDVNKESGLRTESVESPLYTYGDRKKTTCVLELTLPKKVEWCLLLKLSSLEGNETAVHPKHYRMKVVF